MFRKFVLALIIGLLFMPLAAPAFAQQPRTGKWILVETKINPGGAPLISEHESTDGYSWKRTITQQATVSAGAITFSWRRVDRDFNNPTRVIQDEFYSCAFTFDKPPAQFQSDNPPELQASGTYKSSSRLVGGGFPPSCGLIFGSSPNYFGSFSLGVSWDQPASAKPWKMSGISYMPMRTGVKTVVTALAEQCKTACVVQWVYELEVPEIATPTPRATTPPTTPARPATPQAPSTATTQRPIPTVRPERPETERERLERAIAQNLVDYVSLRKRLERDMAPLLKDADVILARLRDAQEMIEILAKAPESERSPYQAEITKLKAEMAKLLESFESRTSGLTQILDGIDSQFVSYSQRQELRDTLLGYRSDLKLLRMTLVLRSGNTEAFDKLFQEYRNDNNIATEVLVGNAFRQLMDGKTRLALESAQLALARDKDNGVAKQLIRDIELSYLSRIRDRLAEEQTVNASLLNEKLNGHGEQGVGAVIIDLFTTGIGESVRGIAGYYDFAQQVASLNIDEAAAQVAGIRFAEELRARGITFEEMKSMTPGKMQEVVRAQYGKDLSEEHARKLRQVLFDAFKNVDVDAIRRGDKTQFNVDLGRQYFDTEILQQDVADFASKQFSAWDTFLTFGPSAQLGRVAKLGVAQRLGLTAETTLQQALQRGLKIHELGWKLYQTESGAAMIDGIYQWEAFQIHVANAIKGRIGDVAYAAGNTAVQAALDKLTEPVKEELKKTIKQVSENYLGVEATASAGTALETVSNLIDFVGLNTDALQRGAYGVDKTQGLKDVIQREVTRSTAAANNVGVAKLAQQPRSFGAFQQAVNTGGAQYVAELQDAKDRVKNAAQGLSGRRGGVLHHAEDTLTQMQEVAQAIRLGDTTRAQTLWNQMQTGSRAAFTVARSQNAGRLSRLSERLEFIERLGQETPSDLDFAKEVAEIGLKFTDDKGIQGAGDIKALVDVLKESAFTSAEGK
ncbi:MAG: hypothetical protein HW384_1221 [Dehalococcoidia bacterium]|nr:hypothetical protein [Dehalococcoidia bacterium]